MILRDSKDPANQPCEADTHWPFCEKQATILEMRGFL